MDNLKEYILKTDCFSKDDYYKFSTMYGREYVNNCLDDYIYNLEIGDNLYDIQIFLWNKMGYYLALLDENYFSKYILVNHQNNTNNDISFDKSIDSKKPIFSLNEEVYYGFHLLKVSYIDILKDKENDVVTLDVDKIFSSIKSKEVLIKLLEKFEYFYNNCSRNSNFDVLFKKILDDYKKKLMCIDYDLDVDNEVCYDELLDQVDMYIKYSIARDKFSLYNLRLLYSFSNKYSSLYYSIDDIFQECYIGLVKSIDNFDVRLGIKFSTYAVRGVQYHIFRCFENDTNIIRIPAGVKYLLTRIEKNTLIFYQRYGRLPSSLELAKILKVPVEKIIKTLNDTSLVHCDSLDRVVLSDDDDKGMTNMDYFVVDNNTLFEDNLVEQLLFQELMVIINEKFDEKERDILFKRFGYMEDRPMTLKEIGELYGCTRERIRQIEKKVVTQLIESGRVKKLNPYNN